VLTTYLFVAVTASIAPTQQGTQETLSVRNAAGVQLLVADVNAQPALRVILTGRPASDRAIEILFPEHVTARRHGDTVATHLYMFQPGSVADRVVWRLDPRLTSMFHDVRLERTYVHHANGFELLASETPTRLTLPLDQWLPSRYLASFTWPVPAALVERHDGITYYYKSRAIDEPLIATLSADRVWVVTSFAKAAGNVWSNPELTCQHVDPQTTLAPRGESVLEMKTLILRGSLDDALQKVVRQRSTLR